MTQFAMTRDINGYNSFGLAPAADKFNTILAATVAQTFTTPSTSTSGKWVAIFMIEPGATVWCAYKTTATLPSGAVASSPGELNPTVWQVNNGDTISCVSNNTTVEMGIKFYAV